MSLADRILRVVGRPLEARDDWRGSFDALVVLGAPLLADCSVSRVVEERLHVAIDLWRRGVAPVICVTGGRTRGAPVAEAEAMGRWIEARGVPASAVIVEAGSLTTKENAKNTARLLRRSARVLLISQPFHLRRARRWFRHFGLEASAFWIGDSLQYRETRSALRWVAREYGAWVYDVFRGALRES